MKSPRPRLLVHATNVVGLGASRVARALLETLGPRITEPTLLLLPEEGELADAVSTNPLVEIRRIRRSLPRRLSRALECMLPQVSFPATERTLVLGDLPLRGRPRQTVFVQQAHLVKPSVNRFASSAFPFRVSRFLFEQNLPSVDRLVVQTPIMQRELEQSYSQLRGRIEVLSHPAPGAERVCSRPVRKYISSSRLALFYPGAAYPHKNHAILARMAKSPAACPDLIERLTITSSPHELPQIRGIPWVSAIGRATHGETQLLYSTADALFFPSLLESYGVPLSEAMLAGLPIVCADLPYARWMCGDQAIYFDPTDADAAWQAIIDLRDRLEQSWQPDWNAALQKMLPDWNAVVDRLLAIIGPETRRR